MSLSGLNKFRVTSTQYKVTSALYILLSILFLVLSASSCKKDKNYIYDVNNVTVKQPGLGKTRVKTTTEFISIVYADLFSTTVPQDTLVVIQQAYDAFGDKKLIEDMIVRHFLTSPALKIQTKTAMRADVPAFVDVTLQKFYNRKPDAFENYFLSNIIQSDTTITPTLVYYSIMTSDEYRYY